MDLGSLLVGLGTLLVFVSPIFWLQWSEKSNKQKRIKRFKNKTIAIGVDIDQLVSWNNNYCLGIDNKGAILLYLNDRQADDPFELLDLSTVKVCKLNVASRKISREKEQIEVIDRISLVFSFRNANTPSRSVLIFDSDSDPSITDELGLAREWEERISACLKPLSQALKSTDLMA